MVELEFWDERRAITIARVPSRDAATVPTVGDMVYIPDGDQSGVYLHLKVNARQFYYSQEQELVTIRLQCEAI